jgi:hypothetical protein
MKALQLMYTLERGCKTSTAFKLFPGQTGKGESTGSKIYSRFGVDEEEGYLEGHELKTVT